MRGALIGELAELQGMNTKAVEAIKAFVVRTVENWIPKFRETRVNFARRLVFCGTTNESQFLADQTGERRWLLVKVGLHGKVNRMGVAEMRTQLWAEARVLFEQNGVMWGEAEKLGALEHAEFKIVDVWESEVQTWLESVDPMTGKTPTAFTTADALFAVVKMPIKDMTRGSEMRMAKILKRQGLVNRKVLGSDGRRIRWFLD
jgi:predicted P-loop ATPase